MGYDCIEHDVNTISVCVCMTIVYSTQKKREFHYLLFQHTLGYECMDDVNNIARCVFMTIAYSALKKKALKQAVSHHFSYKYHQKLH